MRQDGQHNVRGRITRWRELSSSDHVGRRILIASSFTSQPIEPGLGVAIFDGENKVPIIEFADYNQLFQVCLEPDQHRVDAADDVVLIWRIEDVFERDFHSWANGDHEAGARIGEGAASLANAARSLAVERSNAGHACTVTLSDAPVPVGFGLDHDDPALMTRLVALQSDVNRVLYGELESTPVEHLHFAALQHRHGTANTFDRRNWLMYRQPLPDWFAISLGEAIGDLIVRRTAVSPKAIVLDCDGTLWAGVAADDGISGIECGDAFPGFAHRSFQIALQRLRHQGVMLALASKNEPDTILEAFADADGMLLTGDDIVTRRVSWDPKPQAIAEIADELNINTDAVVFVDDSRFEVGAVREQLPLVRTLAVPDAIEELPDLLAETGWFRSLRVTDDDRERTSRMRAETDRSATSTTMSHAEFLASLDLTVRVRSAERRDVGRATQLINKTNQFNLTTRRRAAAEVAVLVESDRTDVHVAEVRDRFGEYGIIGVVIANPTEGGWELDTVLMSCRVLGRGVESAILAGVVRSLRRDSAGTVCGTFVPTTRNELVRDLLSNHGFDRVDRTEDSFELPADREIEMPAHITLSNS
jgi:FkbH-like protein